VNKKRIWFKIYIIYRLIVRCIGDLNSNKLRERFDYILPTIIGGDFDILISLTLRNAKNEA